MIDELTVTNYALIRQAAIEFAPGFTVLSGETGAGKTALVGAIKLLIGERADLSAIADGADELKVSASLLDAQGMETIVSRRISRQGRSRAGIDGELASVATLNEAIGPRFDLLGQHEHQSLLLPAAQLSYLDRYGGQGISDALAEYQAAWQAVQLATAELASLEEAERQSSRDLDDARFAQQSIGAVGPEAGEYERLQDELPLLRRGEELAYGADQAWQLLRQDGQALDLLAESSQAVLGLQGIDSRLDGLIGRMLSAQIDLDDIAQELKAYRESVSFDAQALEQALDRLGQLEGLMRRFGPSFTDVLEHQQRASDLLELADNLPERLSAALQQLEGSEQKLEQSAAALGSIRAQAAKDLAAKLTGRLADLAFNNAAIEPGIVSLDRQAWGLGGAQRFELYFKPGPASVSRPLAKIASGGELSRVMLALKAELIADEGLTLVFDEVDAGIGGQAARAVASYLRRLADIHQVIVVTHLAQIAALADRHYTVEKTSDSQTGVQATTITEVKGEMRVLELARMLSGSDDATALAHARELLAGG